MRVWSGSREKGRAYFRLPAQTLLGEMFYWDDIPPKIGKDELESLDAFPMRDSERKCPLFSR